VDVITMQSLRVPDLRHQGLRLLGWSSQLEDDWLVCYFERRRPKRRHRRRVSGGRVRSLHNNELQCRG